MPTYEYRCLSCRKRFDIFLTYAQYGNSPVICPHCQSAEVQRRVGRVRVAKSEESRLDSFSGVDSLEGLDEDPRALGRMMRKMSGELGEEMPPEFNEVVGRLKMGQSPEQIEQDMPELGADSGPGLGGDEDF